jgi:molybdate transport system substrate-binding protein
MHRVGIGLLLALGLAGASLAAEFKVLAPNAAREPVLEAIAVFEQATGHQVSVAWSGTEAITRRVAEGERVDLVVNAAQNLDRLASEGRLVAATRTDFARSGIGVAVPASSPAVDVSTSEAIRRLLVSAPSVAVSSGTSGRHMVDMFGKLGIGEQLKPKTRQPPSGAQIADVLAAGEAAVGFQQVSELLHAKGIRYLGPLPADLQNYTVYAAAVHASATDTEALKPLLAALRSASVQAAVRVAGMEPM